VGSCRLCHKQRHLAARLLDRKIGKVSLAEANAHGQQLFIAGTWRPAGTPRREYQKKTVPADNCAAAPSGSPPARADGRTPGPSPRMQATFPPPPDSALAAAFAQFVGDLAARHGWLSSRTALIQHAIRIMLGIQDIPGAPILRSDIMPLTRIKHSAAAVAEVLAAAGMLGEDREPPVVRWFATATASLPAPIRQELAVWLDVMRNGNTAPPRLRPRSRPSAASGPSPCQR
jgi:hypothetical protein